MAKEPRVESNIYDLTGNLANAPADDGYPIAGAVFTPAGPIEKRKVLSQKDFIDTYLMGSTVLPTDHDSIKYIFKLLELNPVYVMRACPVTVLEGISSTGSRLVFDKSFNLLPSYKLFRIVDFPDDFSYFAVTVPDSSESSETCTTYYAESDIIEISSWEDLEYHADENGKIKAGMVFKLDSEDDDAIYFTVPFDTDADDLIESHNVQYIQPAATAVFPDASKKKVRVAEKKSLDRLISNISIWANKDSFNSCVMTSREGYLSARSRLEKEFFSKNIGEIREVVNAIKFAQVSTDDILEDAENDSVVSETQYLSIDGYSYYFAGTGKLGVPRIDAPYAISSPNNFDQISKEYFMLKVMAESGCSDEGGFGRIAISLGGTSAEDSDSQSESNAYVTEFCSKNIPSLFLGELNEHGYSEELIFASNKFISPDPEYLDADEDSGSASDINAIKFAYVALRIRDPQLDGTESSSNGAESDGHRYRIYTWGPDTIGTYQDSSSSASGAAEAEELRKSQETVRHILRRDSESLSDIKWEDISVISLSNASAPFATSKFLSKMLDKLISTEKRKVFSEAGAPEDRRIYDSSNTRLTDYYPVYLRGTLLMTTSEDNPLSSDYFHVTTDTETGRSFYQYYISRDSDNDQLRKVSFAQIAIGNYLYYTGDSYNSYGVNDLSTVSIQRTDHDGTVISLTPVKMSGDPVSLAKFNALLQFYAYKYQKIGMYKGNFISEDRNISVGLATDIFPHAVGHLWSESVDQTTVDQFAIVQKFPAAGSIFQFSYSKDSENDDIIDLTLNYKSGTSRESWTMSFVPGVVNGYGIDQFYTRVENDYFKVVNLMGDGNLGEWLDSYTSPFFGSAVAVPEYNVQYMINAMQELPEYEDGLYYYLLTDSGVIDTSYASAIQALCPALHSWYPVSLPSTSSTADLISFVSVAGLNSFYVRMLAASDRMNINGFSSVMPGSYKLIQSVLSLYRSQSNEFAPNYDINHGTVGMSNPAQSFRKDAREKLLDYKIETLKGGAGTDYYINDNVTAQKTTSYMSENQNVLMVIAAVHECENIAKSYKAELNTAATRKRLEDALNSAIQNRLFKGKAYAPYQYYAVCDASNNPLQVINNNQLVADIYAQFTPSSKVIILNHYIIPLDQA